ncbi:hypothetical protein Ae331Ps2_3380c [Pseudonocardia sp. Ae331_Ps2]|nr:hypothetical protein Ae331Ps2_3380c [Pseudonocardia sp. Ae331_Ps2]
MDPQPILTRHPHLRPGPSHPGAGPQRFLHRDAAQRARTSHDSP